MAKTQEGLTRNKNVVKINVLRNINGFNSKTKKKKKIPNHFLGGISYNIVSL